ncbi:MAG: sulfocyanin-like copper-binding protein [Thermoleophilia bacterium]
MISPARRIRICIGAIAVGTALAVAPTAFAAPAKVTITMGKGKPFQTSVSPASAKAGKVTFTLKNKGTMVHEAVIIKTNVKVDKLPVKNGKASEKGKVGAILNVAGGKTSKPLTLNLKKGKYLIICNVPGHYQAGMRVAFTVK